jgi:hypothetical protein
LALVALVVAQIRTHRFNAWLYWRQSLPRPRAARPLPTSPIARSALAIPAVRCCCSPACCCRCSYGTGHSAQST